MSKASKIEGVSSEEIIIHGPKLFGYHEDRFEMLHKIFLHDFSVLDKIQTPWIKWEIGQNAPTHAFLYILSPFKENLSIFCEEVLKLYLFFEEKIPVVFTKKFRFSMSFDPNLILEFKEICLRVDQEEYLYILKKNQRKISRDLISGLSFPNYYHEFLKLKRSQENLNVPVLYEILNQLLCKFPNKIEKGIFRDIQQFLIFAIDSFTKQHSLKYVLKIFLSYYFFKKEIERKSKAYPKQRHLKIKISKTKLFFPFGFKKVLGIFAAINLDLVSERFEKKHIERIMQQILPDASFIQNSFFTFQIASKRFMYLEIERKTGFKQSILKSLSETLINEIKNSIETISSRVISYRNEEEIYRNILLLKDQLQHVEDLPQVVISFHEHFGETLKFHVILLRLIEEQKSSLKDHIKNLPTNVSVIFEKTIPLEPLEKDCIKEANVIRLSFPSIDFLKKNHSIDLLKARNFASFCVKKLIGEFRDFNGGYIDQQRRNFYQLKQELGNLDSQSEIHVENLFYSLFPVTVQASFSANNLKKLFSFFLELLTKEIPTNKNYLSYIEEVNGRVYIFIKTKEMQLHDVFFPYFEQNFFDPLNFALTSMEHEGHLYLGCVYLHPDDSAAFIKEIHEVIQDFFQKRKHDQTLCINLPGLGYSLDPRVDSDRISGVLIKMLYEGLTRIGKNNKPELALAQSVEISKDQKTYIFTLKDARWSNGLSVTAYDFEYAWKKVLDPNFQTNHAFLFYVIKNAEAVKNTKKNPDEVGIFALNEKILIIQLEYPIPYFLSLTAHWFYSPLCQKVCQQDPGWAYFGENEYICNGPFKMVNWERDKEVTLEKNNQYWDKESVKLKRIRILNTEDQEMLFSMFQQGKIHWLGEPLSLFPEKFLQSVKKKNLVKTFPTCGLFWLILNIKSFPLRSKWIRKALAYGLDRRQIIQKVLDGKASIATEISRKILHFPHEKGFQDANIEQARFCLNNGLKEIGLSLSELPPITLTFSPKEQCEELFLEIERQWQAHLGVRVILNRVSLEELRSHLKQSDFQASGFVHYSWFDDPIYHLQFLKNPEYGFNGTHWKDLEFLSLIEKAQNELGPKKREEKIIKAEKIVLEEMPVIPIYFYNYRYLHSHNIQNVFLSDVGQIDFKFCEIK